MDIVFLLSYGLVFLFLLRNIIILYFYFKNIIRYKHLEKNNKYNVSVVIAAYNEEVGLGKTLNRLIVSEKKSVDKFEIIVVDDGSTDKTLEIASEYQRDFPYVRVFSKRNEGKSRALNHGIKFSKNEYIITMDADSMVEIDAIEEILHIFDDPKVGAVSSKVIVGNPNNFLTIMQDIEYETGQEVEKRALTELNMVKVIPGALAAFRRSPLANCGFYNYDTLTEDFDLTLQLQTCGWLIRFAPNSKVFTEAPEDLVSYNKQRTRWNNGTLQVLSKHNKKIDTLRKLFRWVGQKSPNSLNKVKLIIQFILFDIFFLFFMPLLLLLTIIGNPQILFISLFSFVLTEILFSALSYRRFTYKIFVSPISRIVTSVLNMYIYTKIFLKYKKYRNNLTWNKLERKGL